MGSYLLTAGPHRRPITAVSDPQVASTPGPAVIFADEGRTGFVDGTPIAIREDGGEWTELGYEAAEHWPLLGPDLRARLIDDATASLSAAEFTTAIGAGANMITSNWVRSGSPLRFRVAGQLRELVEVLADIAA